MKKEDFERLKAVCEKEGFELTNICIPESIYQIKKKDIWDGVEFARFKFPHHLQFPFFKVKDTESEYLITENGGELFKGNCEPITESAYIEQLKKEAHKRFGEIKDGDRFELNGSIEEVIDLGISSWVYRKETDAFGKHGVLLYKQGKWANRVKERVRVFLKEFNCTSDGKVTSLKMDILGKCLNDTQARLISYEIENILNKEIE